MSDPHLLLMRFDEAHRQHRDGWPAPIVKGRDHALAKDLLESYTMDQLSKLVEHFCQMDDEFIAKAGYGFNIFKSCLPKVLADYQRQCRANVIANQRKEALERDAQWIAEWRSMTPEQRAARLAEDESHPLRRRG